MCFKKKIFTFVLFLIPFLCFSQNISLNRSFGSSFPQETDSKLIELSTGTYFVSRTGSIRLDYDPNKEIFMKISPVKDWNDDRVMDFNTFQKFHDKDKNYVIIQGENIPDDYFLLISFSNNAVTRMYAIKFKSNADFSEIKKNLLNPLSLGGAFSLSLDGENNVDLTPMVYYHFNYTVEGDSLFSYLFTGSAGIILNPSLSDISSGSTWENLLTVGLGIGLFQNIIVTGVTYSIPYESFNWFIGLNLN